MNNFFNKGLLMVGVASFILPFSNPTVQARGTTIPVTQETQTEVTPFKTVSQAPQEERAW